MSDQNKAIIITGKQGAGKTLLAREIAAAHGVYREVDASCLTSKFDMAAALCDEPDALIIDGEPTAAGVEQLKRLVASNAILVDQKYAQPRLVAAPRFIFTTGSADFLRLDLQGRRFMVVNVDGVSA